MGTWEQNFQEKFTGEKYRRKFVNKIGRDTQNESENGGLCGILRRLES